MADGIILIDSGIKTNGIEKGAELINQKLGGVANAAQNAGAVIKEALGGSNISAAATNAALKVKTLESQLSAVTEKLKVAVASDDDRTAERLGDRQIALYDKLEAARKKLTIEIARSAQKQTEAEQREAEKQKRIAEKKTEAERREAQKRETIAQKEHTAFGKSVGRFNTRLKGIVGSALIFNVISAGLRSMTQYFGEALMENDEFSKSVSRLKGALQTLAEPIIQVIAPALTQFVNFIATIIAKIASLISAIFGISGAAEKQKKKINGIGSAAKKAQKQIAGFDELTKLNKENKSGGGFADNFEEPDVSWLDDIESKFSDLEILALAIGAAIAGWSMTGSPWGALVGAVLAITAVGIGETIRDWDNLLQIFQGLWGVVESFLTGDWDGLVSSFNYAMEGLLKSEVFAGSIASEFIAGLFGFESYEDLRQTLLDYVGEGGSLWTLFTTVFDYFWSNVLGGSDDFSLEKELKSVMGLFQDLLDWFSSKIIDPLIGLVADMWGKFASGAADAWTAIKIVFSVARKFFSDTLGGAWRAVIDIFSADDTGTIFSNIKDGVLSSFKKIVNELITGINKVVTKPFDGINSALRSIRGIEILGLKPFSGIKTISVPQIPYLAQGAVLPANKPFLAMVGDQKHGTNVEAPLTTIQEAVANVMQGQTSAILAGFEMSIGVQREILSAVLGIQIGDEAIAQAVNRYNSKMAVVRGN